MLGFFAIVIFVGLVFAVSSSIYNIIEKEILEENGEDYSISSTTEKTIEYGANITRYFRIGEKMTIRYTHTFKPPYSDILPPINFTIISPNSKTTIFWFWLEPKYNPTTGSSQVVVTNLTIYKVGDLKTEESSGSKFIGEALENGNYTLIFTSNYTKLGYMAFVKIISIKEYNYTFLLPVGMSLVCTGTIASLWIIKTKPRKKG